MKFLSITSYFNPSKNLFRRRNYHVFRQHLNTPLLTVEWSPEGDFDLKNEDADILIQISGGDILWQKECLLNIATEHAVSLDVDYAAYLDCDIVFQSSRWFEDVEFALNKYDFVQCYDGVRYLPKMDLGAFDRNALKSIYPEAVLDPIVKKIRGGMGFYKNSKPAADTSFIAITGNPGMAVAIRLGVHPDWKFYDRNLVGGGDGLLMAGMTGYLEEYLEKQGYPAAHRMYARKWVSDNICGQLSVGFADNQLYHLWHGNLASRQYLKRHEILARHNYDPAVDVIASPREALRIHPDKAGMRSDIQKYLASRGDA